MTSIPTPRSRPWLLAGFIAVIALGHLVLGSSFSWPDLAAYAVGVAVGALVDTWAVSSMKRSSQAAQP